MCFCVRSYGFGVKSYCSYCSAMKIVDTNETSYVAVEPHDFITEFVTSLAKAWFLLMFLM